MTWFPGSKGWRHSQIRKRRRQTLYRMLAKRHAGRVPCFCCGEHVPIEQATLEHILPLSQGGTDDMDNLAISHAKCNHRRGSNAASRKGTR